MTKKERDAELTKLIKQCRMPTLQELVSAIAETRREFAGKIREHNVAVERARVQAHGLPKVRGGRRLM
jgi:hypothetical protein